MQHVNLLPWRVAKRAELQRDFIISLVFFVIIAVGVFGYADYYIEGRITAQNTRNALLDKEIAELKKKIAEVENLKKELANLRERMDIVQRLQTSRPEIVHLFDEIPKLLPEGTFLTNLTQRGDNITIEGTAQSNARVSTLMRNIINSKWLAEPILGVIQTSQHGHIRISKFTLQAKQVNPNEDKTALKAVNKKDNKKDNKKPTKAPPKPAAKPEKPK